MTYQAKRKSKTAGKPRTYRGKKVEDRTTGFSCVVTNQDCKRGKPNSSEGCAAALAIKRSHPGDPVAVHVHRTFTYVEFKDKVLRYQTGHALRDQTVRYDAARKFDPGKYALCRVAPSTVARRGQQHSPPDRAHGAANSPNARKKGITLRHHVGRQAFTFSAENSDYK